MPRLSIGLEQVFSNLGIVGNGYKLFFFQTGTTTPKTTYSNEGLSVENTNPIVLNSAGRPDVGIWGSDPSIYRMILGTPDSVLGNITTVVDVDPVDNYSVNNIAGLTPIPTAFWGTTAGTSSAYTLDPALVNITSYSNEQTFIIDFHVACAANPTIDINDIGSVNLKKYSGIGTKLSLVAGDIQNQTYLLRNDGVDIVVLGLMVKASQSQVNAGIDTFNFITPNTLAAKPGLTAQIVNFSTGAVDTTTVQMSYDDTIPQNTEGKEFMSLAITPTSATNKIRVQVVFNFANSSGASAICLGLFQDSTANALAAVGSEDSAAGIPSQMVLDYTMDAAGTTSATTFKVRAGPNGAQTLTFNGASGARKFGGVMCSSIVISEIQV